MSTGISSPDDAFESVRRQVEQVQRIADRITPVTEIMIHDQERLHRLLDPVTEQIIRNQQVLEEHLNRTRLPDIEEALGVQARLAERFEEVVGPVQHRLAHMTNAAWFEDLTRQIERVTTAGPLEDLTRQIEQITSAARITDLNRQIEQVTRLTTLRYDGFLERLQEAEFAREEFTRSLDDFEAAETPEEREQLASGVLAALIAWARALPPSLGTALTVRNVVVFVMVMVVPNLQWLEGRYSDAQRDRREAAQRLEDEAGQARLEGQMEELVETLHMLLPAPENRVVYETGRALPLRAAPHRDGRRLATVPECTIIEQIQRQGRWLNVVYLDVESGEPVTGWMFKRHLIPVDMSMAVEDEDSCGPPAEAA